MKNTAMRVLNFAVKIKNNIRQLYAQNHRLLSYTAVTIISKEVEYSAIVVFVLPHFQLFLYIYFRWLT
ncbi:hypothetical protein MUA68_07365 [Staphylococcus aureus]|nr:hypothetical protein MUA68_07365 [Staphylococcus aureus]